MTSKTTVILHGADRTAPEFNAVKDSIAAILASHDRDMELYILGSEEADFSDMARKESVPLQFVPMEDRALASALNSVLRQSSGEFVLYLDNPGHGLHLKKAALTLFRMAAERNQDAAYIYSDYDLAEAGGSREVKLLFHHFGRVRDNQDYGKAHFFRRSGLEAVAGFDENVKYNVLYDIRLKLSEKFRLLRIGNKYKGSLYTVQAAGKKTNVFDYLLAGKDVQIEAENVVTAHLKRIGAYLAPGSFAPVRKKVEDRSSLLASVIIPVGGRPEFIGTALDSVQAQTVKEVEAIVVVNGGEKDPTADEVRRYMKGGDKYDASKAEVRLFVVDINSIGFCLNLGARNARGKYYVQLDSDDRLKPDAVEKVLKVFNEEKNVGIVVGSYEVWEKHGDGSISRMEEIPVVTHDEWTEENGRNNLLRINGAGAPRCIPIHVIEEMGWFSLNDDPFARNYGEDYEMVNKIAEHYRVGRVWDAVYEVIRHSGGTDHAISQDLVDRNDEAKDDMRKHAIERRIRFNAV